MNQEEALDILKMGHTSFVTGGAGSGKTYLLNKYIDWLSACKVPYAVTAATGIAATHLGGQTIHSWSGLGIKKNLSESDLDDISQKQYLHKRWNETSVLIIDEVSMLSADQLDMLDMIGRVLRMSSRPFGGMTVIFSGDFFQLPPIDKENEGNVRFAYESDVWLSARPVICYLETQHRHKGDSTFSSVLNSIRDGAEVSVVWEHLERRLTDGSKVSEDVTRLYTHNKDVDTENEAKLDALKGQEKAYDMQSKGKKNLVEALKRGCLAPETLRLKKGAEVMFVKNDPKGWYVNGTRGVVTGFKKGLPVVETRLGEYILAEPIEWHIEENGKVKARISQVPLRLAWALTVHKSQGMTLDEAYMELSGSFVAGQGYVALSRVRHLKGLHLGGLNEMALKVDDGVQKVDVLFKKRSMQARKRLCDIAQSELIKKQKNFVERHGGVFVSGTVPSREPSKDKEKTPSHHKTLELLREKKSLSQAAKERGVKEQTILNHIEKLLDEGEKLDLSHIDLAPDKDILSSVRDAVDKHGWERLTPLRSYIKKHEGRNISYRGLRKIRIYEKCKS